MDVGVRNALLAHTTRLVPHEHVAAINAKLLDEWRLWEVYGLLAGNVADGVGLLTTVSWSVTSHQNRGAQELKRSCGTRALFH